MTELLYMQDFDVEQCSAVVQSVALTEDGRTDITLDQTCFYARGGGQDWDKGVIISDNVRFQVEEVRLDETGNVHHIGMFEQGVFESGQTVDCEVDKNRRAINTRLHSGGHIIDMAIDSLGLDWIASKGQHYVDLSALEYSGTWNPEKAEELRLAIEAKANELVESKMDNKIVFMPVDEMHTVCKHVPDNIPRNKPGRVVMYGENFGIPCGGTHVKNLEQIGEVKIPKLKEKKGIIRLSYAVTGVND